MTIDDASAFLQIEAKELRALVTSGEIPCIHQGERMMFEHDELDNWYSNRLVRHIPVRHIEHARPVPEEIRLADYCRIETMETNLCGKTKPAILRALTELAERSGLLYDPKEFLENIQKREEIASTAMAEGIALVHPQTRDEYTCEAPFIAIAKTSKPVFFGEANGVPTDIFFVVCSADAQEHIQLLAKLCKAIENGKLLNALREAESPEEMMAAVENAS